MDVIFIPAALSAAEADARIEAGGGEAVMHGAPDLVQGERHRPALLEALAGGAALAHSLPAQAHPGGVITAAPLSLAAPETMAMHAEERLVAVTRGVAAYRRDAYLGQPRRWSDGASESVIWPSLAAQGGAALAPQVTALQQVGDASPLQEADWTRTALFGGWLTHLLNAIGAPAPANTDAALERLGFPGRAGDRWFDEEIALSEAQKADLRGAFHAWLIAGGTAGG